jgi:uncharacterized protein
VILELQQRDGGVVLRLQAVPGSRRNAILGVRNGALRVAVTQVAEKGKANKALIAVLAKQLGLQKSQIAIIAGESTPKKQILVASISMQKLRERIDEHLESGAA